MPKVLTVWMTTHCGKFWKRGEYQTHLTCLLRNLYAVQEATVRTGCGADSEEEYLYNTHLNMWKWHQNTVMGRGWKNFDSITETALFQVQNRKGVRQCHTLSSCLFNSNAEYIIRNAGVDETQAGIKIVGRNINNLRCADDTTLMAESEEELKSLLMKVKDESEKVGLKFNIQKTKIMASDPISSWQIDEERLEIVTDFIFWCSRVTANGDCNREMKRHLLFGRKVMINLDITLKSRDITLPTKSIKSKLWSS